MGRMSYIIKLFILVLLIVVLTGCTGGTNVSTEIQDDSEKESISEINSNSETDSEIVTVEFPEFGIQEINLENSIPEDEIIASILEVYYSEDTTYILALTTVDYTAYDYRLIYGNLAEGAFQSSLIQTPEPEEGEYNWFYETVDKEGNVYMARTNHYMDMSCVIESAKMMSWDKEGNLRYEIELLETELSKYRENWVVFQCVSEDGYLIYTISGEDPVVIYTTEEGRLAYEFEAAELDGYNTEIRKDGNRSLGFLQKMYQNQYQYFDINSRTFSKTVPYKKEVEDFGSYSIGLDKENIIVYAITHEEKRDFYQYNPFTGELKPFLLHDGTNALRTILSIDKDRFLVVRNELNTESNKTNKLYLYTLRARE